MPFEIEVFENIYVYSPIDKITFGLTNFKPLYLTEQAVFLPSLTFKSDQNMKETYLSPYINLDNRYLDEKLDIYLINKSPNNLHIKDIYLKKPVSALSIEFVKNLVLIADPKRLTKVASVHFDSKKLLF